MGSGGALWFRGFYAICAFLLACGARAIAPPPDATAGGDAAGPSIDVRDTTERVLDATDATAQDIDAIDVVLTDAGPGSITMNAVTFATGVAANSAGGVTTLQAWTTQGRHVWITWPTVVVGTYVCGGMTMIQDWQTFDGTHYVLYQAGQPGSDCVITVTTYGGVGGHILGTFSGTLAMPAGEWSDAATSEMVSGSFDFVRRN